MKRFILMMILLTFMSCSGLQRSYSLKNPTASTVLSVTNSGDSKQYTSTAIPELTIQLQKKGSKHKVVFDYSGTTIKEWEFKSSFKLGKAYKSSDGNYKRPKTWSKHHYYQSAEVKINPDGYMGLNISCYPSDHSKGGNITRCYIYDSGLNFNEKFREEVVKIEDEKEYSKAVAERAKLEQNFSSQHFGGLYESLMNAENDRRAALNANISKNEADKEAIQRRLRLLQQQKVKPKDYEEAKVYYGAQRGWSIIFSTPFDADNKVYYTTGQIDSRVQKGIYQASKGAGKFLFDTSKQGLSPYDRVSIIGKFVKVSNRTAVFKTLYIDFK